MAKLEDESNFWTDEYFFTSQDPLIRENEKRYHDDTGERVPIVRANQMRYIKKSVVQEAAKGIQEESVIIYHPSEKFSRN